MATHDKATHEHARQQIEAISCLQFPFLDEILRNGG